jgi:hypothetical protein
VVYVSHEYCKWRFLFVLEARRNAKPNRCRTTARKKNQRKKTNEAEQCLNDGCGVTNCQLQLANWKTAANVKTCQKKDKADEQTILSFPRLAPSQARRPFNRPILSVGVLKTLVWCGHSGSISSPENTLHAHTNAKQLSSDPILSHVEQPTNSPAV